MTKQLQVVNAGTLKKSKSLFEALNKSILQPWILDTLYTKTSSGKQEQLCDYAILFGKNLLLFTGVNIHLETVNAGTQVYIKHKQLQTITQAQQSFNNALIAIRNKKQIFTNQETAQHLNLHKIEDLHIYTLCVTSITSFKNEQKVSIKHGYTDKQAQQFSLDTHMPELTTSLFSLGNFVKLLNNLGTITDVVDYLEFHRQQQTENKPFKDETDLLKQFIGLGHFLERARNVDTQLIEQGFKSEMAGVLQNTDITKRVQDFKNIKKFAQFWESVIVNFTMQISQLEHIKPKHHHIISVLMSESLYTRSVLTHYIHDFKNASAEQQANGYMMHARSYTNPNRHYVFWFYALDENSENHRSKAIHKLKHVAAVINTQQQNPPLDEIIVIGVTSSDDTFETDIFYSKGVELTQEQLKQIKDAQQQFTKKTLGRNQPCYCNSGKRYKHCHGKIGAQ